MKLRIFLIALFFLNSPAFAGLNDGVKVFSSGKWTVLRDVDKMSDKVVCTGVQNADYSVQLSRNSLYVVVKGGISTVLARFDDAPPLPYRGAEGVEKSVGAVIFRANTLSLALSSKRLRLQVATLVSGIAEIDIDLTGIDAAMQNINEDCPIPAINNVLSPPPAATATPSFSCDKNLAVRLLKAGVSKSQIDQICTP